MAHENIKTAKDWSKIMQTSTIEAKIEEEYEKYRVQRDKEYPSDFDRDLAKYLKKENK